MININKTLVALSLYEFIQTTLSIRADKEQNTSGTTQLRYPIWLTVMLHTTDKALRKVHEIVPAFSLPHSSFFEYTSNFRHPICV